MSTDALEDGFEVSEWVVEVFLRGKKKPVIHTFTEEDMWRRFVNDLHAALSRTWWTRVMRAIKGRSPLVTYSADPDSPETAYRLSQVIAFDTTYLCKAIEEDEDEDEDEGESEPEESDPVDEAMREHRRRYRRGS